MKIANKFLNLPEKVSGEDWISMTMSLEPFSDDKQNSAYIQYNLLLKVITALGIYIISSTQ